MERPSLSPKNFIRNEELLEIYTCGICYEICIKPVRCRGSCQKYFCMKCVSKVRLSQDRCPNRCSSPFLVQKISDIIVEFTCPYNSSKCLATITSLEEFNLHYQKCDYVSEEELFFKKMQREYRCLKQHKLEFFVGTYEEMCCSTCSECQEVKLCRSICRICDNSLFCVSCRAPPCSKVGCPLGHRFEFHRISNLCYICDICGISTALSNDGVYDDKNCNFGICETCYSELPQEIDPSMTSGCLANHHDKCFCGKEIGFVHQKMLAKCGFCKKDKQCPKFCKECNLYFCLSCKNFQIYSDWSCDLDHQLIEMTSMEIEPFIEPLKQLACMRCEQEFEHLYFDRQCYVRLCKDCLKYCRSVRSDKDRPAVNVTCKKGHQLTIVTGKTDYEGECSSCHQTKLFRMFCNYCADDSEMYCFSCRPIKYETCYFGHKFNLKKLKESRECHICMKMECEFHYCKKCSFYICLYCMKESLSGGKMEEEVVEMATNLKKQEIERESSGWMIEGKCEAASHSHMSMEEE